MNLNPFRRSDFNRAQRRQMAAEARGKGGWGWREKHQRLGQEKALCMRRSPLRTADQRPGLLGRIARALKRVAARKTAR